MRRRASTAVADALSIATSLAQSEPIGGSWHKYYLPSAAAILGQVRPSIISSGEFQKAWSANSPRLFELNLFHIGQELLTQGNIDSAAYVLAAGPLVPDVPLYLARFESLNFIVDRLPQRISHQITDRARRNLFEDIAGAANAAIYLRDYSTALDLFLLHQPLQSNSLIEQSFRPEWTRKYSSAFSLGRKFADKGYATIGAELLKGIIDNLTAEIGSPKSYVFEQLINSSTVQRELFEHRPGFWPRWSPLRSTLFNRLGRLSSSRSDEGLPSVSTEQHLPIEDRIIPRRNLNAWIDSEAPSLDRPFQVSVNIGLPKESAAISEPFPTPDRASTESVDLLVSLSSLTCDVDPDTHRLALPRMGETETIVFAVVARNEGEHKFSIKVHLAKQLILLQSYEFAVKIRESAQQMAAYS